jgi:hypothetical protein
MHPAVTTLDTSRELANSEFDPGDVPTNPPPLPQPIQNQSGSTFSNNVKEAIKIIERTFRDAWFALYGSDSDPTRLRVHASRLETRAIPILSAMHLELDDKEWITLISGILHELLDELVAKADQGDQDRDNG